MTLNTWTGTVVVKARAHIRTQLPLPCPECGEPVDGHEPWVVAHLKPRWSHPELTREPTNWTASHRVCSDRTGRTEQLAAERARAAGRASNPIGRGPVGLTPRPKRTKPNGTATGTGGTMVPFSGGVGSAEQIGRAHV